MSEQNNIGNNKRIAKNTIMLYVRMMFIMIVSLYTSRIVLDYLGITDYGIYQSVGGFVALLAYVNAALGVGSSRFLTFELGTGNFEKLEKTFSTVLTAHIILAIIIFVAGETFGIWFFNNKLVIPEDRISAAMWTYQFSIITCMVNVTQIPYSATIISHERMSVYAYLSIIDGILKLLVVYLLLISTIDKLILYSALLCILQVCISLYYRLYCKRNFAEAHYKPIIYKDILYSILKYSGWNLLASTSVALCNHGVIVVMNMFFNPAVVAARAVANQVNLAANHFVSSFRTAVNPQIVKKYAANEFASSRHLLLTSMKFSFYLMLLISIPICFVADQILTLWLVEVPEYSTVFLQFSVCTSLFAVFDLSFYTALYAKGQIKENAICSSLCLFIGFIVILIGFKSGVSPVFAAYVLLISQVVISLVVKPIMVHKIVGYPITEVYSAIWDCIKVSIVSIPIPMCVYINRSSIASNNILLFVILVFISVVSILISIWLIGLKKTEKNRIISFFKNKLKMS